jgi:hypothetical protein
MFSISFNTSINRKHINDNLRVKCSTRALSIVEKEQKRDDDDAIDIFNVVDDVDAANEIDKTIMTNLRKTNTTLIKRRIR